MAVVVVFVERYQESSPFRSGTIGISMEEERIILLWVHCGVVVSAEEPGRRNHWRHPARVTGRLPSVESDGKTGMRDHHLSLCVDARCASDGGRRSEWVGGEWWWSPAVVVRSEERAAGSVGSVVADGG